MLGPHVPSRPREAKGQYHPTGRPWGSGFFSKMHTRFGIRFQISFVFVPSEHTSEGCFTQLVDVAWYKFCPFPTAGTGRLGLRLSSPHPPLPISQGPGMCGDGLGRRKCQGWAGNPCLPFDLCNQPQIPEPSLQVGEVGGWGLQPVPNQWCPQVGQTHPEHPKVRWGEGASPTGTENGSAGQSNNCLTPAQVTSPLDAASYETATCGCQGCLACTKNTHKGVSCVA